MPWPDLSPDMEPWWPIMPCAHVLMGRLLKRLAPKVSLKKSRRFMGLSLLIINTHVPPVLGEYRLWKLGAAAKTK
ncbi:hypothetical protein ALFP_1924 [Alcaligenes faecalis]|nr:hypothetical protein ALFP_1924 [Alcaligenes faecalis]